MTLAETLNLMSYSEKVMLDRLDDLIYFDYYHSTKTE